MLCCITSVFVFLTLLFTFIISIIKSLVGKTITGGNDDSIELEYSKWLKTKEIEKLIINKELHSIVERWLITNINSTGDIHLSNESTDSKFISECAEKDIPEGVNLLNKIKNIISNEVSIQKPSQLVIEYEPKCLIKYKLFTFNIRSERLNILRKFSTDDQILKVALRYSCLLPSSQQWAIPLAEYKKYVEQGYTIEAFASPFNSQIIRIGDYKFCSLFPTDGVFGSIGNFFSQKFENVGAVVNPPFVESILESAADKCIKSLEAAPCKFIFYGPTWTDAEFYKKLSMSKYLVKKKDLTPGKYYYEDLFNDKLIKAKFKSTVWTLSSE